MKSFVSSFQFKTIRIEKFQKEENENKLLSLSVISTAKKKQQRQLKKLKTLSTDYMIEQKKNELNIVYAD